MQAASIRAHHRDLVEGLIALRPKKRVNKVSWVIFAGCAYFVVALFGDASVREALLAPKGEARAPQYVATQPAAPAPRAPAPVQVQVAQAQVQQPGAPGVVTFPAFAVPATAPATATVVDAPLPHAKAHHTAPTHRAHPRGAKHAK